MRIREKNGSSAVAREIDADATRRKTTFKISRLDAEEIAREVVGTQRGANVTIYCINPHSYETARRDPVFWDALSRAHYLLADGVGIKIAKRLLGQEAVPRITGHDMHMALCNRLAASCGRLFLLGSSNTVLDAMRGAIETDFPGLTVCGTLAPPFSPAFTPEEAAAFAAEVNAAGPDVLYIGLTAPKQELLARQMLANLDVKGIAAIGAVFDFVAGTKPRAPTVFVKLGLEWLYRLTREPRRLWRRTFLSGISFLWGVASGRVRRDIV